MGASSLTGRYWLGSLWYYTNPERAPDVDKCTAGVQLEAGLRDASWVDVQRVLVGLDTGTLMQKVSILWFCFKLLVLRFLKELKFVNMLF